MRMAETILTAVALLCGLAAGALVIRGVRRDESALREVVRRLTGGPGLDGLDYRWVLSDEGQRASGALSSLVSNQRAGSRDVVRGGVLGIVAALTGSAGAFLAIWG